MHRRRNYLLPTLCAPRFADDGGDGGDGGADDGTNDDGAGGSSYTAPASQSDLDRIVEQRLARERKQYGMTPAEAKAFKERAENLANDLSSETEKKIADAKREADEAAQAKYFPGLAAAKLEAAAAGRPISPEQLSAALAPLQASGMGYFKAQDGTVDTDKVTAYIDSIAPATGNQQQRSGPSTRGHGNSSTSSGGGGKTKAGSIAEVRAEREAARAAKASTS